MENTALLLSELVQLSHELGKEERQLAILGEGNTSADCGDGTFWVKASGSQLGNITEAGFSRVRLDAIMDMMKAEHLDDKQVSEGLQNALTDKTQKKPSVETFLHALCIKESGAHWVGHTHAVSVNQILCSQLGVKPFLNPIFPDEIVVCGIAPAVIPYVDPGFALAVMVRDELQRYQEQYGHPPKWLLMENHGVVALGQTTKDVFSIMLMADKVAKIILGTYMAGGPNFMTPENADRIENRLDEKYRRKQLT